MSQLRNRSILAVFFFVLSASAAHAQLTTTKDPRTADIKSADGTILRATYFSAATPGPGAILFHQSNRNRQSWDAVAHQLAAAGINALSVDERGYGESSGKKEDREQFHQADLNAAFEFLVSQPGIQRDLIGAAGAGWLGVDNSVETARLHPTQVKSLVLISGETLLPQLKFLHQASNLPGLFVVSDDDEYPPTVEAMEWLYDASSSPEKQFIHYFGPRGPWIWYETSNASKVPATGSHGTDLFQRHPELPGTIVDWFVTTLIKTPGHSIVDAVASAAILKLIDSGDLASAKQQLLDARRKDPKAQLWPEVNVDIFGEDHMRQAAALEKDGHAAEAAVEKKLGVETFELNLLAYPDSADAHSNLADAYLQVGEKKLALEYARKALAMIDSHAKPLSSWSDTPQRRAEVRSFVEDTLKKLDHPASASTPPTASNTSGLSPGANFRDCIECPEMLVIPAGKFIMGSSAEEKSWAAVRAGSPDGVADEAPQHEVSVPSFALGKYDVTRAEYSAFVRETGHSVTDGCGIDGFEWKKQPDKTWQNPGYKQTDRDPVVCVSWRDAKAYIDWVNSKVQRNSSSTAGLYRLPSESEWEYATRAGSTTKFFWGDDDAAASDYAWFKSNADNQTHPVGQKRPNQFGLYDMVGNVWQWTEDCYDNTYSPAPTDGRANETPSTDAHARDPQGNCLRVDRGAWFAFPPWALRSATRERNPADYRDTVMGFRLAKSLD
ncbi:MAG TPA: SUMF1/EgtB/PvdO family nonheme iron enzyme [Candidatus Acidoferrum sp.]|nr:SUMF1/EgtB/PvdO family nonheme iron enzyme [Candidatus Acidoferrum sp.]